MSDVLVCGALLIGSAGFLGLAVALFGSAGARSYSDVE